MLRFKQYVRPGSLEEAWKLNQSRANCVLGGTGWLKMGERQWNAAIDLSGLGLDQIEETEDGMIIHGGKPLHGATIDSHLDHRIAMTFSITALASDGETKITGADCVKISYPGFYEDLAMLAK